ncbi:hypothetical protein DRE_06438 [Drechslerella stenobrocha 248]|uniref:Kelch repeat-containing protein n=1 Tax=Drechslerella stenobrocha 248 TaxID=1043628 RepID=W7I751_9PEZI|nr:hypothetical protein DRE_06438 [Drechslerella stenobrocha 248]
MAPKCRRSRELFTALAALFIGAEAQLRLEDGLCQRFGHQSTLVGDKLILAGGFRVVRNPGSNNATEQATNDFQSLDLGSGGSRFRLSSDSTSGSAPWQSINYTVSGASGLPKVANGAMFRSGDDLYIYEGRLPEIGPDASSSLWKYTNSTSVWAQELTWTHANPSLPNRVSRGAGLTVGDRGIGVYLGGARIFVNESATPKSGNWVYPSTEQVTTFDLRTLNRTTAGLPDSQKRAGAALGFLPIGTEGAIIGIGGTLENDKIRETGNVTNIPRDSFRSSDISLSPMQRVWIMDLATRKWYSQSTFGQYIPDNRMEHCIAVASAPDNSSHNIYMFGGSSGSSFLDRRADKYYNDLYILSIPSFRWIRRTFEASDNAPAGRVQHTCHVYGNKLIVLGGATQGPTDQCSWDEINVLDMTSLNWVREYWYTPTNYSVPALVMGSISNNGVVQSDPVNGWDDHDLEALFVEAGYSTSNRPKSTAVIAAVAGGVAGGIILLLVAAAAFVHFKRKYTQSKRKRWDQSLTQTKTAYDPSGYPPSYDHRDVLSQSQSQGRGRNPSHDTGALELSSSPTRSVSSSTYDSGTGYAHPGQLWRNSYYSVEASDADMEEREDDEARLISRQQQVPDGYFEMGLPARTRTERFELGDGDLSEPRIKEAWEAASPVSSRHGTWR